MLVDKMDTQSSCEICDEMNHDFVSPAWISIGGEVADSRCVGETTNFFAIVSLGPISPGHLIVCPKCHCKNMFSVDSNQENELSGFVQLLSTRLIEKFERKSVFVFEHGASECSKLHPCTVGHAHWHLVPSDACIGSLRVSGFQWRTATRPEFVESHEYLMLRESRSVETWFGYSTNSIPSQVLRKRFALLEGHEEWDWRRWSRKDVIDYSIDVLATGT